MPTVLEVIRRVLPQGTNPAPEGEPVLVDWRVPPLWPPDLFAATATLVSLSGAYAHASVTGSTSASEARAAAYPARVEALGEAWRQLDAEQLPEVFATLQERWSTMLAAGARPVSEPPVPDAHLWCDAALELMAIADAASAGIGFGGEASPVFSQQVADRHFGTVGPAGALEPHRATATVCKLVPPEECCVQPKSRTPQVGCTLRSLSHHLALLPPLGEVTTSYLVSPRPLSVAALNLLLVPFPFRFDDAVIRPGLSHPGEGWGRFAIDQRWFPPGDPDTSGETLARFLGELVDAAGARAPVHGLVLPELALDRERAKRVGMLLASKGISLFVTGVLSDGPGGYPPRNSVMCVLYQDGAVLTDWEQSKHHRWRIERGQIASYGLSLDPALLWWENTDVSRRHVRFCNFLDGATLAAIVCEDLARIDPVQPVIRAVGPNLVIALLMDGSQHEYRWPGRYATVLAEDPGSSVLTLTSAGFVDRYVSRWQGDPTRAPKRAIGLRKDASPRTEQIVLPVDHHAMLLELEVVELTERTMDRRSDEGSTREIRWRGISPVRHPAPPDWLNGEPGPTSVLGEATRGEA
jgi:hypothetical protein